MNNPFENDIFKFFWKDESIFNTNRIKEIIEKDKPTVEQTANFVADVKNGTELFKKLYFIYKTTPVTDVIGWSKTPEFDGGIGGYLKVDFYKKLYDKTEYKNELFPFLPGDAQTDEMLTNYLKNGTAAKISNYHGENISPSTMEWIIDNHLGQIKFFKEEWWTPKLKTLAIKKSPFAISFIPESLLTKAEIRDFLKNLKASEKQILPQLWSNLPKSFKNDPEIFARWLILMGGLQSNYKNVYTKDYYTLENVKKYFELVKNKSSLDWLVVKAEWKEDLVDIALPNAGGAIAKDLDVELTNSILEKTLSHPIALLVKGKILLRLFNEGRLTPELIERLNVTYYNIECLKPDERKKILDSEDIIDYLVKSHDSEFLKKKTNWPKGVKLKKEQIIDLMQGLNFSFSKIKARIKNIIKTEDDYLWLYFEANKKDFDVKHEVRMFLRKLTNIDKHITIPKETTELLTKMGDDATYDDFKATTDIFLF